MIKRAKKQIEQNELLFLIIQTQIGVGILSLPFAVFTVAESDGWISILIAGAAVQILLVLYWSLCRKYPTQTFFEISETVLGTYLGKFITLLYSLFFLVTSTMILIIFSNMMNLWFFHHTPRWFVIGLMILIASYLAKEELRVIVRFHLIVSVMIIILILLVTWSYSYVNPLYVLPVGKTGIKNILHGSTEAIIAMLGFEILLFVYPYVKGKANTKLKTVTAANLFVTLIYAYMAFTCYIFFSPQEILLVPQPILYMLKAFSTPVVERIDLLFMSMWVVSVSTSFISYLFLSSKGFTRLFNQTEHRKVIPYVATTCLIVSNMTQNDLMIEKLTEMTGHLSLIMVTSFPLFCYVVSLFRKKRRTGV